MRAGQKNILVCGLSDCQGFLQKVWRVRVQGAGTCEHNYGANVKSMSGNEGEDMATTANDSY
ncbi:hypothetical protein BCR37DRAFT_378777, partial [Protomyces lactucae-debilis]